MPRDDFSGKGKYARIATALNDLGLWVNRFRAAPPLLLRSQPGGGVALGLSTDSLAGTVLGQMRHPFQLTINGGNYEIRGGNVHTGTGTIAVSGLSGGYTGGSRQFWLTVTYPNDGTADAVIDSGGTVPSSDHLADTVPAECGAVPAYYGWARIVVPLASATAGVVSQCQYSDLYLPRGKTLYVQRVIGHEWNEAGALRLVVVNDLYVNGVLRSVGSPACETVFATGGCPE
jgi:hypothetical protein